MKNNIMLMIALFVSVSLYADQNQESVLFQELRAAYGDEKFQEMMQHANQEVAHILTLKLDKTDTFEKRLKQLGKRFTQEQEDELAQLVSTSSDSANMTVETRIARDCIKEAARTKYLEENPRDPLAEYAISLGSALGTAWTMALLEQIDPELFIHIMQETLKRDQQK